MSPQEAKLVASSHATTDPQYAIETLQPGGRLQDVTDTIPRGSSPQTLSQRRSRMDSMDSYDTMSRGAVKRPQVSLGTNRRSLLLASPFPGLATWEDIGSSIVIRDAAPETEAHEDKAMQTPDGEALEPSPRSYVPINLLGLAPEILLNVLYYLSAREILRARILCRHFQRLIDNKSNHPLLVSEWQFKTSLEKLVSLNNYDIRYFNYLQILAQIVRRKGLWPCKGPYNLTIHIMTDMFMRHGPELLAVLTRCDAWQSFWKLGYTIWHVHFQHHLPHSGLACTRWAPCVDMVDFVSRAHSPVLSLYGITEVRLAVWYRFLTETPGGYLKGIWGPHLINEDKQRRGPVTPPFRLTGLYGFDAEISTGRLSIPHRPPVVPDASKRLTEMLGIAQLPTGFQAVGRVYADGYVFAWFARSKGVFEKVRDALERGDGGEWSPLEKAVIKEDLFIF